MKSARHLIMSAALAVAFLSAGAFAQTSDTGLSHKPANVTVIAKTAETGFAS